MINLPIDQNLSWPVFRIYVRKAGGWIPGGNGNQNAWELLPQPLRVGLYGLPNGYELKSIERATLPEVGSAVFQYQFGDINGRRYGVTNSPTDGGIGAAELIGYDVRITVADPSTADTADDLTWRTCFLGTVIHEEDKPWPSNSSSQAGVRIYRCADLLWRTQRWPLNRHAFVGASYTLGYEKYYDNCFGHPGYNYQVGGYYRKIIGNREAPPEGPATPAVSNPIGDIPGNINRYYYHSHPCNDISTTWDDKAVIEHALHSSRGPGDPVLLINGNTGMLSSGVFAWQVADGEVAFDLLGRVLSRQRGRGLAALWWDDDSHTGAIPPDISPYIKIFPQNKDNITYSDPSTGGGVTVSGATSFGTNKSVDLEGDHRIVPQSVSVAVRDTTTIDYLESVGEPLEILCTLSSGDGSLEQRWADSDATAFLALTNVWQRKYDRWRPVFQRFAIPSAWNFQTKNGNNGTSHRIDFQCNDLGVVELPSSTAISASPILCKILPDLPLYEGYDYSSSNNTRYDGAIETFSPVRRSPILLYRYGANQFWDMATYGWGISQDDFGIYFQFGPDAMYGSRALANYSTVFPSGYNLPSTSMTHTNVKLVCGLQTGNRVRMASGSTAGIRRKTVYHSGIHLWLSDSASIWEHDVANVSGTAVYQPAKYNATNSVNAWGILRDDRSYLALMHNLTWAWYKEPHRTASWTLRDCGLLPGFTSTDSTTGSPISVPYPQLGDYVSTLTVGGLTYTPNTCVTSIRYDNTTGQTTWVTDWMDLDFAQ